MLHAEVHSGTMLTLAPVDSASPVPVLVQVLTTLAVDVTCTSALP